MCFPKEDKTFLEAVPAAGGANETEENMKIIKGTAYCVLKQLQKVTSATELLLTGHKAKPNASGSLFLLNMIFMFFRLLLLNHWYKRNNAHWHTINNNNNIQCLVEFLKQIQGSSGYTIEVISPAWAFEPTQPKDKDKPPKTTCQNIAPWNIISYHFTACFFIFVNWFFIICNHETIYT